LAFRWSISFAQQGDIIGYFFLKLLKIDISET